MSGSTSAPPGADPEVMVRMWAVEAVMKSRMKNGGGAVLTPNDAANVNWAAEPIASYVLHGLPVEAKA